MHALVELARRSVEEYVRRRKVLQLPHDLTPEMKERLGVFICIKKRGELRGCIGTYQPCCENVGMEIIRNAVAAASQDPRFLPVAEEELSELAYSVDILTAPEKVDDLRGLDPKEFGVIVSCGSRRGLLLPDLEGVDTVADQIRITKMKAGIAPGEEVEVRRFRVRRYT